MWTDRPRGTPSTIRVTKAERSQTNKTAEITSARTQYYALADLTNGLGHMTPF